MSDPTQGIRLNKYISETGYCSRREADRLIEQGRVTINGQIPLMGTKVMAGDDVWVDGKPLVVKKAGVYLVFHKPVGITCTTERHVEGNIIDFINHPERIFPIGRLDKPSEGLIFLTSDGDIVNKILRAGNQHEKEYVVTVDRPMTDEFIRRMGSGVPILGTMTQKCRVVRETNTRFRIVLTQGLNRQIRRMCEALGYHVIRLVRVRIMNITVEGLRPGAWRNFSEQELDEVLQLIATSSKTEEASKLDASQLFEEWE